MKTKLLLVSTASAIATFCSATAWSAEATCTQSPCAITVTVTGSGSACKMTPDKDPLHLKTVKDASIVWTLKGTGWGFCKAKGGGVILKTANDGQFSDNFVSKNGTTPDEASCQAKYHWKDKNTVKNRYDYKIVIHDASGAQCVLDPAIINDM